MSKLLLFALVVFSMAIGGASSSIIEVQNLDEATNLVQTGETETETAGLFKEFLQKHGKRYDTKDEYERRFVTFAESLRFVREWNNNPRHTFRVGINEFADLTQEEFASRYLVKEGLEIEGEKNSIAQRSPALAEVSEGQQKLGQDIGETEMLGVTAHVPSGKPLPDKVDWAEHTGHVYKQGVCAACYTFTTNAAIEAEYFLKTGKKLPELSDQEILSCSRPFGNHGCIGGNMEKSYHYIRAAQHERGGMTLAKDYPYAGAENSCDRKKFPVTAVKLAGYRKVMRGSEGDLADALATRPVAVGIDAHHPAFKLYESGVFDIDYCTTHLTHAVLIVGYGSSGGKKFWKMKNSWGKQWGESGYGKIVRGKNMCAISNLASYPVLDKPEEWSNSGPSSSFGVTRE